MALGVSLSAVTASDATFSVDGAAAWLTVKDRTASLTGIASAAQGGTGIAFFQAAGPTVVRTYTFPDANATIARTDAANTFTGIQTFITPIATGSVATMTATVGGGVPTPPNNTTTFLRGDGTFAAPAAGGAALSGITAATGANTIASGNNHSQIWNWALTSNSVNAFSLGETTAATGGTSTSGVPNQNLLKLSTLAASTASPLSVFSRGSHVFSVSPTTAQILIADGSNSEPSLAFAGATGTGLARNGSTLKLLSAGSLCADASATQFRIPAGSAATPSLTENQQWANAGLYWPDSGMLAVTCSGREQVRWAASSGGGGWQIMDEADSNPTTTNLDAADSFAMYMKADKLVIAHNLAGVMNYLTIPLDGSSTAWTQGTGAP